MVAGLIAMHVAAQQTFLLDVLVVLIILLVKRLGKELVQCSHKLAVASEALYHPLHVVRHMEGIVGAVAFDESLTISLQRREILLPAAVGISRASQTQLWVEYLAVVESTQAE